jgi:hypothetical protein
MSTAPGSAETGEAGLAERFGRVEEALAEAEAAPLSVRKARIAAVLLDDFTERAWNRWKRQPERVFGAEDLLAFRARVRVLCPAMATLAALAEGAATGPRLEVRAVAVPLEDYPGLSVHDFMVSLYNAHTVMRVIIVETGGATRALPVLHEAADWWRGRL